MRDMGDADEHGGVRAGMSFKAGRIIVMSDRSGAGRWLRTQRTRPQYFERVRDEIVLLAPVIGLIE